MKTFNERISNNRNRDAGGAGMAMAQNAVASPSPSASPTGSPGTATAESVVVTSQELDISREQIVPSLGRRATPSVRIVSIHRRRAKTHRSTKPSCASPESPKTPSVSCTSAANTLTYSIASTMCSCPKAFPGSDRNCRPVLPIIFR
jgi:hypothetical protein